MSRAEEVDLFRRVRRGDEEAVHRLVRANLRFVVRVARQHTGRGVPLIDLIAEGNAGLLEAVRRFDEERGVKFITYAVAWVRQYIRQAIMRAASAVRLPTSRFTDRQKLAQNAHLLGQELGREPTFEEMGVAAALSAERIHNAIGTGRHDLSLDAPLRPDTGGRLGDCLEAPAVRPNEELEQRELRAALQRSLETLDVREYRIVCSYFGLDGGGSITLEELGDRMGLTRERVRQLRDRALSKVRRACGRQLLELSRN